MMGSERLPYPYKVIALKQKTHAKITNDFKGYPNGLVSCNHWGYKLSATVTPEELEDLYNYPLDPRDVWVVTSPKCGTTWTQEMVWLLANDLDYEGAKTKLSPGRWNFMDFPAILDKESAKPILGKCDGPEDEIRKHNLLGGDPNRPSPRFVKSHLPMSMNNPRLLDTCKVVYVARNIKDACVSYYHHHRLIRGVAFDGDMEMFMDYFMDGNLVSSPFIEHMIEAWNLRHHPNMCYVFFEDMKRDLKPQIHKVAKFLGKSYSDEQVDELASHLHIDNFKKNPYVNKEDDKKSGEFREDRGNFIRKGKTGDWKNHFTPEMDARFSKFMAEKMKGTDLSFVEELDKQD